MADADHLRAPDRAARDSSPAKSVRSPRSDDVGDVELPREAGQAFPLAPGPLGQPDPAGVLELQRVIGNRAVTRLIGRSEFAPAAGHDTVGPAVQRKVEMRDVGRGEQSGYARLPELVERLNNISRGLTFSLSGRELVYTVKEGGTLSNFDQQIKDLIDLDQVIPVRLTNRRGLERDPSNPAAGYVNRVFEDTWASGYADVDDLLASNDLGLQMVLLHLLTERAATRNYAARLGSSSLDLGAAGPAGGRTRREFAAVHARGIEAETRLLRDFFGDPSIRLITDRDTGSPEIARIFRNSRRDSIRVRAREGRGAQRGVDVVSVEVVTRDGRRHSAEEYKQILAERQAENPQ